MSGDSPVEVARAAWTRWRGEGLGPGVVAAVSGGADSVGLLRILAEIGPGLGLDPVVAHLDHGVRGAEAGADAAFVAGLAASLGLPFEPGRWSPSKPAGFEAEARRARYAWLAGVAARRGASAVAVGHTRDDQAETILMRILRGTGPRGLAGMPASRPLAPGVTLVRPILDCRREEVRAHLSAIGQAHREDASNADTTRTRARIRLDLLPRLAGEYNPAVVEAIARLGRLAGEGLARGARRVDRAARAAVVGAGPLGVTIVRAEFDRRAPAVRAEVVRAAWRRAGWPEVAMDEARWLRLATIAPAFRGRFSAGGGIDAWADGHLIRLAPATPPTPAEAPAVARLPIPGSVDWGGGRLGAWLGGVDPVDESVDLDRVEPYPGGFLVVGPPAAGDRFAPLGMGGRSMALADFLRGRRVPRADRPRVPIVRDRRGVAWVAGHRIADRLATTGATTRRLGLRWSGVGHCG